MIVAGEHEPPGGGKFLPEGPRPRRAWEQWIEARLDREREGIGTAIGKLPKSAGPRRTSLAAEVRRLWAVLTELQQTMAAFNRAEHAKVLNMPSPLTRLKTAPGSTTVEG